MAGPYSHGHLVLLFHPVLCVTTDECLLYRFICRPDTVTLRLLICFLWMFRRGLCWKCIICVMESNFIWPMCFSYSGVKSSRSSDHECCWSFYYIFGTRCRPWTLEPGEGVPEIATLFLQWDECFIEGRGFLECVSVLTAASWSEEMMTISSHPADSPSVSSHDAQVSMCGLCFLVLFMGNFFTTVAVVRQKIKSRNQKTKKLWETCVHPQMEADNLTALI